MSTRPPSGFFLSAISCNLCSSLEWTSSGLQSFLMLNYGRRSYLLEHLLGLNYGISRILHSFSSLETLFPLLIGKRGICFLEHHRMFNYGNRFLHPLLFPETLFPMWYKWWSSILKPDSRLNYGISRLSDICLSSGRYNLDRRVDGWKASLSLLSPLLRARYSTLCELRTPLVDTTATLSPWRLK